MKLSGWIELSGIVTIGILAYSSEDIPDALGVVVGSSVVAIAALFSKKS